MTKSKKILIVACIVFFIILAFIAFDIASRTTFPGHKSSDSVQVEETSR